MPIYDYHCDECEEDFEVFISLAEKEADEPQECEHCGSVNTHSLISPPNFILKGDGWSGKNERIKRQMAEKNRGLRIKEEEQKRDAPGLRLAPNVEGERVDSWSDAKKLAASKGKDTSGYEQQERKAAGLANKPTLAS